MTTPISLMHEHHSTTILDETSLNRLDGLYLFYHKQWWCKRQMFYRFKKCNAFFNGMALVIMATSVVIGSVWKDSFVVVGLTSFATLLKGWNDFKKYSFKMDMCKFAYKTYEKTLIELGNYVRAGMDDSSMSSLLTIPSRISRPPRMTGTSKVTTSTSVTNPLKKKHKNPEHTQDPHLHPQHAKKKKTPPSREKEENTTPTERGSLSLPTTSTDSQSSHTQAKETIKRNPSETKPFI